MHNLLDGRNKKTARSCDRANVRLMSAVLDAVFYVPDIRDEKRNHRLGIRPDYAPIGRHGYLYGQNRKNSVRGFITPAISSILS